MREVMGFFLSIKDQWRKVLAGILALVLLRLIEGPENFRVPGFVYWLIFCATFFWAFFGAWTEEYKALQTAEGVILSEDEKQLLNQSRKLSSNLLLLMHRFPGSPAVRSPFGLVWRPSPGDPNVEWEAQQMIAWHKECIEFLDRLRTVFGLEATSKLGLVALLSKGAFPEVPPSSTETLMYWGEIEAFLLNKVL